MLVTYQSAASATDARYTEPPYLQGKPAFSKQTPLGPHTQKLCAPNEDVCTARLASFKVCRTITNGHKRLEAMLGLQITS